MIKSLSRDDIQTTPFIARKSWNPQNVRNDDLILWMSGSLSGSISHMYIDYDDGTVAPYLNTGCKLALQQQENIELIYQQGKKFTGSFFPVGHAYYDESANPTNYDLTYKGAIYNTNKELFYNTRHDPTLIFGLENINLSDDIKPLTDIMDVFSLTRDQLGERIVPKSVSIVDNLLDESYKLVDDGNTNLVISGSYFSNWQVISATSDI